MKAVMATSSGHVGQSNEDFVGATPGAVVLLDGAGIPGTEKICHHGVAWYAHTLGATFLGRMACGLSTSLTEGLSDSIEQVAKLHGHSCDLANPSSPQATVAAIRVEGDRVDYLVLADTFAVLDEVGAGLRVITDGREVAVRTECTTPLRGLPEGTDEYERARVGAVDAFRARRNQRGGYWIAKDDPQAAMEALTGSVPREQVRGAALLSNGASRIVDPYRLAGWDEAIELLRTGGPERLLRYLRNAEAGSKTDRPLPGFKSADDASAVYCEFSMPA